MFNISFYWHFSLKTHYYLCINTKDGLAKNTYTVLVVYIHIVYCAKNIYSYMSSYSFGTYVASAKHKLVVGVWYEYALNN